MYARTDCPYRLTLPLAALSAALLLAACGGGGGGGSSGSASTPAAAPPTLAQAQALRAGTTVGTRRWPDGPVTPTGAAPVIDQLGCGVTGSAYHAQTHVSIIDHGTQLMIPAQTGYVAATSTTTPCQYPIHTDDASGNVQVEAPAKSLFTLGQWFDIWGQPLTTTNVGGITGSDITFWVNDNGTLTKYTGDPRQLELADHRQITIIAGTPPAQLPAYTWADIPPLSATPIPIVYGQTVGTAHWGDGDTPTGGQGQVVDTLACGSLPETYHVHSHVSIFLDGQQIALPASIGILGPTATRSQCNYPLHTHDQSGKIHVESAAYQLFTLGQFADIWGFAVTGSNIADLAPSKPMVIYMNNGAHTWVYTGDPRNIELTSHLGITFQVGAPIPSIPTYSWDGA